MNISPLTSQSRRAFLSRSIATALMTAGMTSSVWGQPKKLSPLSLQSPWINDAEFIGYFVAIQNGYYEDEAISFQYLPGGPDKVSDTVLLAGNCDVALTTPDTVVNEISTQGAPLKIIGTQYQKSPLGIVSLKENKINSPKDLIGKRLAVPPANQLTTEAFLRINGVNPREVRIVPYQYDPAPLVTGAVDATVDFVTNVPYSIRLRGKQPSSFLFYDFGFKLFNDTVTVTEKTLKDKQKELVAFFKASRRGWSENFVDLEKYPKLFQNSWYKDTKRDVDNEIYFNNAQRPLIESTSGVFGMTEDDINENIKSLNSIGLKATRAMFVTDILSAL